MPLSAHILSSKATLRPQKNTIFACLNNLLRRHIFKQVDQKDGL